MPPTGWSKRCTTYISGTVFIEEVFIICRFKMSVMSELNDLALWEAIPAGFMHTIIEASSKRIMGSVFGIVLKSPCNVNISVVLYQRVFMRG